ncbi:iron complex transport system permease protein [Sanguibacter antarcticus]|uniref:Iron complex transport system permease protein n=1 Tax=Sanguibacter antarcticus TaxID=372484 RepID=A0A2A9E9V9_9MICO|nr:iron complex transport system permease protein [Sanguibacter antarcticus]
MSVPAAEPWAQAAGADRAPRPSPSPVAVVRAARRERTTRYRVVTTALVAVTVGLVVLTLCVGAFMVSFVDVLRVVGGADIDGATFVVWDLRLPRTVTAVCVGVAFGLSGAIFQTLVRNPLASPDIIGITAGASAAAVVAIMLFGLNPDLAAPFAFGGALVAAAIIYLLAWRGSVSGYRLVLVGIGVAAILNAVVSYALTRGDVIDANEALVWITGSLNASSWGRLPGLVWPLLALLPVVALLARPLRGLQLGDDLAAGIGVRPERSKLALIVVAVALAAIATAAAGPVAFVAFVSAPIARRLAPGSGLALVPSGLVGACVVLAADFAGAQLFGDTRLPVGIITGVIGAPFLLWLLAQSNRTGKG